MPDSNADRNLLFGVLALQLELIDPRQFADACAGWASRKEIALGDLLAERGWISKEDEADVDRLLERKLKRHGGDVHASLAAVADERVQSAAAAIADPEVRHSLAPVPGGGGHFLISTIGYAPESRERYTLTRLHAQGGIGQVWLARDADLGREVALKELRPERASNPAVWARFLEEARITGQLEHPNIVPVHELVTPAQARNAFYTMRFVKGRTLSEAIQAYHRDRAAGTAGPVVFQALLNAFLGVCNAVAYAHSRGVIHRDLKPQNVVLGDYGEVIVLDWGLAKLVDRPERTMTPAVSLQSAEERGETMQGQVMGTPAYMAPEQAEGRWDDAGRCSDVYGLGAILYEILTGKPPFDASDAVTVLRQVVHEPPVRPRAACSSAPAALEEVCLKALAKRPEDRYGSARELADEVRHFLADEPVSAYREPISTRLIRWGRRHRTAAAAAAVLLVSMVVGLSLGTVLLGRANARIEDQRRIAEANFRKARQAVDEYFTKISESKLLSVPGLTPLRKELLESARKYYEEFTREQGNDRTVQADLAEAWYRIGFVTNQSGSVQETLPIFSRAAAMYRDLAQRHPDEVRYLYKLAMCLNDLGIAQAGVGSLDEAARTHHQALELRERIARAHPDVAEYQKELALSYGNLAARSYDAGRIVEALDYDRKSRAILEALVRDHPAVADYRHRLAGCYNSTGSYLRSIGRTEEALRMHQRAVALMEQLVQEDHPADLEFIGHLDFQATLASSYSAIGLIQYRVTNQFAEALQSFRRALPILETLARENPTVDGYQAQLAGCLTNIGVVQGLLGKADESLKSHRRALAICERLVHSQPSVAWYQNAAAYSNWYIGQLQRQAGREEDATRSLQAAKTIFDKLAEANSLDPYDVACIQSICGSLVGLGKANLGPEEQALRQRYADRAMATLRTTTAGGFHNAEFIQKDPDFASIRSRGDFQKLMDELRAKNLAEATGSEAQTDRCAP